MGSRSRFPDREVHTPQTPGQWCFYLAFLAVILAMLAGSVVSEFSLSKLVAVFYVVFWIPLLMLHELGHALAAKSLGWYAGQLVIGVGPTAKRLRLGETHVEIRWLPLEGFVRCVPRNLNFPRVKNAFIYLAGPGVELLLVVIAVLLVGTDAILQPPADVKTAALQGLCLAAATGAMVNLVPHWATAAEGDIPNDGLGILWSFLLPREYFAAQIGQAFDPATGAWEPRDTAD